MWRLLLRASRVKRSTVSGDARGAKGVVADARGDAARFRAPLNHRIGVGQLPTAIFGAPIGGEAPDFRAPLARESNL
jgi:hypothetical protein